MTHRYPNMLPTTARQRPTKALMATLLSGLVALSAPTAHAGMDPYVGEVMLFASVRGSGWCPRDYLPADGSLLPLQSYQLLFSLIGTTYGGNGSTNFALPDLRGRTPIGQGQGPGLSNMSMGQSGGSEQVTLSVANLPPHTHTMTASTAAATYAAPAANRVPAQAQNAGVYAAAGGPSVELPATGIAGQGTPVPVRSPYLVMNWCIAVNGIYPSQQ